MSNQFRLGSALNLILFDKQNLAFELLWDFKSRLIYGRKSFVELKAIAALNFVSS